MNKWILAMTLMALTGIANAGSKVWISPVDMMAGDFVTRPDDTVVNDTKPWLAKSLSATALVIGDVADNTATAFTASFLLPNNYRDGGTLYLVGVPADSDETVKFQADVQVQPVISDNATVATAVTVGSESTVMGADTDDNLNYIKLPNNAFNNLKPNQYIEVYVGRSSGTGENFHVHGLVFDYKPKYFGSR